MARKDYRKYGRLRSLDQLAFTFDLRLGRVVKQCLFGNVRVVERFWRDPQRS